MKQAAEIQSQVQTAKPPATKDEARERLRRELSKAREREIQADDYRRERSLREISRSVA